jgi:hypothetical protein
MSGIAMPGERAKGRDAVSCALILGVGRQAALSALHVAPF